MSTQTKRLIGEVIGEFLYLQGILLGAGMLVMLAWAALV